MDDDFTAEGYDVEEDEEYASWITWFCELKGNEFFCMVDREFIVDEFNLTGLSSMVTFYHYALDLILDLQSHDRDRLTEEQKRLVEISAETLYGLIHARFITTARGLKLMEEKFVHGDFGGCPRVFCGGQAVLPVGQSDVVRESSVKLFCPKCEDIFYPCSTRHKILDGAFWGTTFPHLLLMQMRDSGVVVQKPTQQYVPRIYGFRIRKPQPAAATATATAATTLDGNSNGNNNNNSGAATTPTTTSYNNNTAATLTTPAAASARATVAEGHVDGRAADTAPARHLSTSNNNNNNNNNDDDDDNEEDSDSDNDDDDDVGQA